MKKLFSICLVLVLTFCLSACGCQAQKPTPETTVPTTVPVTTAPTTMPTTEPTTLPPMDPTVETNIPDPEVDVTTVPDVTEDTAEIIDRVDTGNETRMRIK